MTPEERKDEVIKDWLKLPHEERRNVMDRLSVEGAAAGPQTGAKYHMARRVLEALAW